MNEAPRCVRCGYLGTIYGPLDGHGDAGTPCPDCPRGEAELDRRLATAREELASLERLRSTRSPAVISCSTCGREDCSSLLPFPGDCPKSGRCACSLFTLRPGWEQPLRPGWEQREWSGARWENHSEKECDGDFVASMPPPCCGVPWVNAYVDDNDDRTRLLLSCAKGCGRAWGGCRAKRLSPQADEKGNREAWGPVGHWRFTRAGR